jgi:hypothetical protein
MTADLHTTSPTTPLTIPPTARDGGHTLLPWLREMRDEHPVWRDAYDVWHVFRYVDVARVISARGCSPLTRPGWSRRHSASARATCS